MSEIERRSLPVKNLELRQRGGRAVLAGTAIVFDQWSLDLGGFVERVSSTFVDRTLDRVRRGVHRLLALWNHESSLPIGNTSPKGGLKVTKRSHGLDFELPASNLTAAQRAAVERGDIRALSFGFNVSKDEWEKGAPGEPDRRTLLDGEILEISPVLWPAYPQTNLLLAKRSHEAWRRREQGRPASPADDRVVLTGRELREAMKWNLNEARRTAAHEAGHVVVMLHEGVSVRGARLLWRETAHGRYRQAAGDVTHGRSSGATAASYLVGMLAEDPNGIGWNPARASRSDLSAVRRLAPRAQDEWTARQAAKKVLRTYRRAYVAIYSRLLREGEVSGQWCQRIFNDERARLKRLGRAA